MGKINLFTVITTIIVQFVVGYLWYGTTLFGDVMTTGGGHAIDFLKMDGLSILLLVLSSYGLTHVFEMLGKLTGTKDVGGGIKLGLTVGTFALGLPVIMLLNLLGFGKVVLLVVFCHLVLISVLTNIVIIKLKKV